MNRGSFNAEAGALLDSLRKRRGRPLVFMEVCGSHTMAAARCGLHQALPPDIRLISGPGCPVCVTPVGYVDKALVLARLPEIILTTFGDLMRVPGSWSQNGESGAGNLLQARAGGGDVRSVYSPLLALQLARDNPDRQVVFLGVGFETTAPALAAVIRQAACEELDNFSMLCAARVIPPALEALVRAPDLALDGFMCPGHVSVILGAQVYQPLVDEHGLACAIAGFEPREMLRALTSLVDQIDRDSPRVDNCYPGAVSHEGNPRARQVLGEVFELGDASWRGLGVIPNSGLLLREEFAHLDAHLKFPLDLPPAQEPDGCRCGDVLRGVLDPVECPLFGRACSPDDPRGACMVSSEGACAARFQYDSGGMT